MNLLSHVARAVICSSLLIIPYLSLAQDRVVLSSATDREAKEIEAQFAKEVKRLTIFQHAEREKVNRLHKDAAIGKLSRGKQKEILMHLKGEAGVKFVEPKIPEISKEMIEKIKKKATVKLTNMVEEYKKKATRTEMMPPCEKDERKIVKKYKKNDPQRQRFRDSIYIPHSVQAESDEENEKAFGKNVKVATFADEVYVDYRPLIAPFGFGCLPVRYHMGKQGLEVLRGDIALRNFDEDEEGEMDRDVQRRWDNYKRRAKMKALEKEG